MKPEQWQQAREVLADALELKPEDRSAFLDRACSSDHALRREVERLLSSSDEAKSSFLESSALRVTLMPGTKLGDYEVERLLGSGGMGEVYRARDARLGREVAIKVLPAFLSHDPDRLRRFEQEARAAAALNHPNILAVHQLGTYEGAPYLVSELLEGVTLREQLVRGPMPLRKAIECGVQIARGLAAAHEKGIVHRDLKPENLFVTKDGRVKILDFGLAKLMQRPTTFDHNAPTVSEGTEPGVVMGTVGYMSPEQVCGNAADQRADIFAFGAILYEMLVGKRAFQKPTSAETMSAILNEDPPGISQIVPNLPPGLQRVAHRCLEKNPEQRFQSASDLAFALEALSDPGSSLGIGTAQMGSRSLYWWAAAAVILTTAALGAIFYFSRSSRPIAAPTLTRLTWDSGLTTDPALSPDGKLLAYASDRSGEGHLDIYLQQVGGGEPLRLTSGPGDKVEPVFSPNATSIAFHSEQDGGIYVVSTLGGTARKLVPEGDLPRFSPDGKWIAYSVGGVGAGPGLNIPGQARMYVVASTGGVPKRVRPDFAAALYPIWAPDGQNLLFLGNPDANRHPEETVDWWITPVAAGPAIKTGVLESTRQAKLAGDFQVYPWVLAAPTWEPDGAGLVFSARSGDTFNLWRIAISPATFKVSGTPRRLTSGLTQEEHPSVATAGDSTLRVAFASIDKKLAVWALPIKPNEGKVTGELQQLTSDAGGDFMGYISRDGARVVFVSVRPGNQEIWLKNLSTGQQSAVTASRATKYLPMFSPDGALVSFTQGPNWDGYVMPSNGGIPQMVCSGCGVISDWSSDGKRLIGNTADGKAWMLDLASRHKSDLLATQHWIAISPFSPDNRWFAFLDVGSGGSRSYIARVTQTPVPQSDWIAVMDGEVYAWSPDGSLVYGISWRDGHSCIWAQRLASVTKRPVDGPSVVFHSHNPRLSIDSDSPLSIGGNKLVFSMGERTGNIWMAEWKEQ